jgi:hypothetical protein
MARRRGCLLGSSQMAFDRSPLTPSDWIALSSLMTAVLAFIITVWQSWQSRRHDRLSVRPLLTWNRDRKRVGTSVELTFKIQNCGLGPAVVKDRYFTIAGARFSIGPPSIDEVPALAKRLFDGRLQYNLPQHGLPGIDSAIPAGGEFVIATLQFLEASLAALNDAAQADGALAFTVRYESMYGDEHELYVSNAVAAFAT